MTTAKTELESFIDMLRRAWVGHGIRSDSDGATGVQVELGELENDGAECEFLFDADGKLVRAFVCK